VRRRLRWVAMVPVLLVPGHSWGQGKPHVVSGSPSTSAKTVIKVNQEYCDSTGAYSYNSGVLTKGSSVTSVTTPIATFDSFGDPGTLILAQGHTGLMSDGSDAARLLVRAFYAGACGTKIQNDKKDSSTPAKLDDASYYVINVVSWKKASNGSAFEITSNEWFTFNLSDRSVARQTPFGHLHPGVTNDARIYGSKKVGFLAVHLKSDDISDSVFKSFDITYNVTVKEKQAINVQDLIALIGVLTSAAKPAAEEQVAPPPPAPPKVIGLYGGGLVGSIKNLPDDIVFDAKITFPKSGAPTTNSSSSTVSPNEETSGTGIRLVPAKLVAKNLRVQAGNASNVGSGTTSQAPAKSVQACDSSIDSKTSQQAPCSFSQTYDDEGLYNWDVSVGVPVNSINELQYSSTDGKVTGKAVSRLNAYGFFDIYPVATDLKSPPGFGWPHIMVGLPFSGKVFNKPFFGAGGLINPRQLPKIGPGLSKVIPLQLNFYGGLVYNKEFIPGTLGVGSPASPGAVSNNLVPHRVWKGQFGIEFSIRDVKDKLTSGKGAKSSTKPTSNSQ
jgi:hypothetical protein